MTTRERFLLGALIFVLVGSALLEHAVATPVNAVPLNGVNLTRLSTDVCPSGSKTCIRADSSGNAIEKRDDLISYLVAASPSPSPGQCLTYNTTGMWTPASCASASMSIGGAITSGTAKSVLFVGPGPVVAQDNANFQYDSATHSLTASHAVLTGAIGIDASNLHAVPTGTGDTITQDNLGGQTLTNNVIAGATASGSNAIDLSGGSGAFKTTTGAITVGGSSSAITIAGNTTVTSGKSFAVTSPTIDGVLSTGGAWTWFPPDIVKNLYSSTALQSGNFTVGITFMCLRPCTVSTLYAWYPGPTSHTLKLSIWDSSGTRQGSCTVAVSTAGLYPCSITPVSVPAGATQKWKVSYWENSGTHYWVAALTDGITPGAFTSGRPALLAGPNIQLVDPLYIASAGDVNPTGTAGGNMAAAAPGFTVP